MTKTEEIPKQVYVTNPKDYDMMNPVGHQLDWWNKVAKEKRWKTIQDDKLIILREEEE